jgi:hypothetical protein
MSSELKNVPITQPTFLLISREQTFCDEQINLALHFMRSGRFEPLTLISVRIFNPQFRPIKVLSFE